MNWIVFSILALVLLFTPYQRGLFFDTDMYPIEVLVGVLFIFYAVWMLVKKPKLEHNIYLVVFLLPFMYLISLAVAETPKGNLDNLFRWIMYSSLFVVLLWIQTNEKIRKQLPILFQISGIVILSFALLGYWGWLDFEDIVLKGRLSGTFQYANTFAVAIGAYWLYSMIVLTNKSLRIWQVVLFSLSIIGFGTTMLLSESRGAFLIFSIAWFIGLFLLNTKRQLSYIFYSSTSFGGAFWVYSQMQTKSSEGASHPGLWEFIVASIVLVLITAIFHKVLNTWEAKVESKTKKDYYRFLLPVLSIVMGALLVLDLRNEGLVYQNMPEALQNRISTIDLETNSVVGRFNFFGDAMKMSQDAPLLGLGGDGWRILFTKYQDQPYWSSETHNGFLEILLNTGWIGLIVFILVFLFLFIQIGRRILNEKENSRQVWTIATLPALAMIFLHSTIDFNFSFGTIWFIVFWLFAMGVANDNPIKLKIGTQFLEKTTLSILVLFVTISSFYSLKFWVADYRVDEVKEKMSFTDALRIYEKAESANPYNVDYLIMLANIYSQAYNQTKQEAYREKVISVLKKMESLEPNNPAVLNEIGQTYAFIGDAIKADDFLEKALEMDRFNVELYSNSMKLKSSYSAFLLSKDPNNAKQLSKETIALQEKYHALFGPYKEKPIPNMRKLELRKDSFFYIAQAFLILGQYEQALEAVSSIDEQDDPQLIQKAGMVRFISYEKLSDFQEAQNIMEEMRQEFPEFEKSLDDYKKSLGY